MLDVGRFGLDICCFGFAFGFYVYDCFVCLILFCFFFDFGFCGLLSCRFALPLSCLGGFVALVCVLCVFYLLIDVLCATLFFFILYLVAWVKFWIC